MSSSLLFGLTEKELSEFTLQVGAILGGSFHVFTLTAWAAPKYTSFLLQSQKYESWVA